MDKGGVAIAFGVVFDEDFVGFFAAVLGDEPARGFRDEAAIY